MNEWILYGKIHKRCGGICRMVESKIKGVGMTGECLRCHEIELMIEEMIPLERVNNEKLQEVSLDKRKKVEWKENQNWTRYYRLY